MRIINNISKATWGSLAATILLIIVAYRFDSAPVFWWVPFGYGVFTLICLLVDFLEDKIPTPPEITECVYRRRLIEFIFSDEYFELFAKALYARRETSYKKDNQAKHDEALKRLYEYEQSRKPFKESGRKQIP